MATKNTGERGYILDCANTLFIVLSYGGVPHELSKTILETFIVVCQSMIFLNVKIISFHISKSHFSFHLIARLLDIWRCL